MTTPSSGTEKYLTNFAHQTTEDWEIVNDGVMGGCSQSLLVKDDDCAVFTGEISLENNGGFASVRCRTSFDLSSHTHMKLSLKGDGKRYCFRLRTASRKTGEINRFSYDYRFVTKPDVWKWYLLPLNEFRPYFRGRALDDVAPLDRSAIRQIGFLISDKQEGKFKLHISQLCAAKLRSDDLSSSDR